MRTLIVTSVFFIFGIFGCLAQGFQGIAVYQLQDEVKIKITSPKMSQAMKDKIMGRMKQFSQKEFILTFDQEQSVYQEKKSLGTPGATSDGIQVFSTGSNRKHLYRNVVTNEIIKEKGIFGKDFLVKDTIGKPNWKLINETKKIGKYLCFKAVLTKEVVVHDFFADQVEETEGMPKIEIQKTTVWYTPQVPVHHGPAEYWGLPGLIMQVQEVGRSWMCTKVVLNPKEGVKIEIPNKGKEIGSEEFNALQKKKMKEWMERNSSGSGDSFSITINK